MKRSKEVDSAIRRCWAKLARRAFAKAESKVDFAEFNAGEDAMKRVEKWLDLAGANATKWHF